MTNQKKKTASAAKQKKSVFSTIAKDQRKLMMDLAESHYGLEREALKLLIVIDWLAEHAPQFPPLDMTRSKITNQARQAHCQAKADFHED